MIIIISLGHTFMHGGVAAVFLLSELHMSHHHQRGTGHKDQLESPQTNVRDGEDGVIAHCGAARLEEDRYIH